jgi:opacity protein-like surface antigen
MTYATVTRSLLVVATTTFLLAIAPAQAQEQGSFYFGGGGGFVLSGNTRADGVFSGTGSTLDGQRLGPAPGKTAKGNFDPSLTANFTVGYDMGKRRFGRFRFEGELFYQKADTDNYKGELNGSDLNPAGQVNTSMMGGVVNALYDLGQFGSVTPYTFLGFGFAQIDTKYDFQGTGRVDIDGSSEVIQGGFGANMPFGDGKTLDMKYRFRRAGLNESGLDIDIDAHILEVGIRW